MLSRAVQECTPWSHHSLPLSCRQECEVEYRWGQQLWKSQAVNYHITQLHTTCNRGLDVQSFAFTVQKQGILSTQSLGSNLPFQSQILISSWKCMANTAVRCWCSVFCGVRRGKRKKMWTNERRHVPNANWKRHEMPSAGVTLTDETTWTSVWRGY